MAEQASWKNADIVIVGAGVMGTSLAFYLASRKAGRIVLIEKNHVASGSTGRSSALVRMHYAFPNEVQLALKSLEVFQNFSEIVGEGCDFRKTGYVRVETGDDVESLKRNVEMQKLLGVDVQLIGRTELKELQPDWHVDDVELAAYEPESGYSDGAAVATGYLTRARDLGVAYLPKTEVHSLLHRGSKITGIATTKGEIESPTVVLAAGLWTNSLLQPFGIHLPIEHEYHEVAILKNPKEMRPHGAACGDGATGTYFRSDSSDKTIVGDRFGQRPADPDRFPQRPTQESLAELWEFACHRVPALKQGELIGGITGLYDMTPDGRPMVGKWPDVSGLHIMAGFSGTGFKIAPAVGMTTAEELLDGKTISVDMTPFRPTRFVEGQLIQAEYEYKNKPSIRSVYSQSLMR